MEELLKVQDSTLYRLASVMARYAQIHGIEPAPETEDCETAQVLLDVAKDFVDVTELVCELSSQDEDMLTAVPILDTPEVWVDATAESLDSMVQKYVEACIADRTPAGILRSKAFNEMCHAAEEYAQCCRFKYIADKLKEATK